MAACQDCVDAGLVARPEGGLDLDLRTNGFVTCGLHGLVPSFSTLTVDRSVTGVLSNRRRPIGATARLGATTGVAADTEMLLAYSGVEPGEDSGDGVWDGTFLTPTSGFAFGAWGIELTADMASAMAAGSTLIAVFRWRGLGSGFPIVNHAVKAYAGGVGIASASFRGLLFPGTRLQVVLYGSAAIPSVTGGRVSMWRMGVAS